MTAGFPDRSGFRGRLAAIASARTSSRSASRSRTRCRRHDHPKRASQVALAGGFTLPWLLGELAAMQPKPPAAAAAHELISIHCSPTGSIAWPAAAARAGVPLLIPDLPYEESAEMRAARRGRRLALVQMVTP